MTIILGFFILSTYSACNNYPPEDLQLNLDSAE